MFSGCGWWFQNNRTSAYSKACFLPRKTILSFIYKLFTADSSSWESSKQISVRRTKPRITHVVTPQVPSRWLSSQTLSFYGSEAALRSFAEEFTAELKALIDLNSRFLKASWTGPAPSHLFPWQHYKVFLRTNTFDRLYF